MTSRAAYDACRSSRRRRCAALALSSPRTSSIGIAGSRSGTPRCSCLACARINRHHATSGCRASLTRSGGRTPHSIRHPAASRLMAHGSKSSSRVSRSGSFPARCGSRSIAARTSFEWMPSRRPASHGSPTSTKEACRGSRPTSYRASRGVTREDIRSSTALAA